MAGAGFYEASIKKAAQIRLAFPPPEKVSSVIDTLDDFLS